MDRRVKERLVGATILVVLIVLIVPELLSGPKQAKLPASENGAEPVHNVTVDLSTSKAMPEPDPAAGVAAAQPEPTATAPGKAPGPGNAPGPGTGAGQSEYSPAPAAVSPTEEPAAPSGAPPAITTLQAQHSALENGAATPKSKAIPSRAVNDAKVDGGHSHWAVQVGSFASQTNAERLSRQLKTEGFATYVIAGGAGRGSSLYRVRVGPLPDRASAERTISRLGKVGHSASVVSP